MPQFMLNDFYITPNVLLYVKILFQETWNPLQGTHQFPSQYFSNVELFIFYIRQEQFKILIISFI